MKRHKNDVQPLYNWKKTQQEALEDIFVKERQNRLVINILFPVFSWDKPSLFQCKCLSFSLSLSHTYTLPLSFKHTHAHFLLAVRSHTHAQQTNVSSHTQTQGLCSLHSAQPSWKEKKFYPEKFNPSIFCISRIF